MGLKVSDVLSDIIKAASASLGEDWSGIKDFAEPEFKRLAQSLVDIGELIAAKKVTKRQGQALLNIHKNTTQIVLLTAKGLGVVAVENAINAALRAVRNTVNTALGFKLL